MRVCSLKLFQIFIKTVPNHSKKMDPNSVWSFFIKAKLLAERDFTQLLNHINQRNSAIGCKKNSTGEAL